MYTQKAEIMDSKAISRAVARISFEIIEKNGGTDNLCVIGVLSRGACLADRIAKKLAEAEGKKVNVGFLDITAFRDDRDVSLNHEDRSSIDFSIADARVILVDDVIFTGRSVRAAIDAIMARGRPKCIQLAALIDRGHRELPIRADFIGKNLPTSRDEIVKVSLTEIDSVDRVAIYSDDDIKES